jgi:outer membrane receptor for ferrienterochelin and colicins
LQDVWTLKDNLSLTWGVRYDYFEQFDDYVNYRMALNYSPSPLHSWKLMYGTGIRTPTLREYQKVLDGTTFEPPIPDAERFESLELGYYLNTGRYRASLTAYNNRLAKFIYETPTPDGLDEYFINGADRYRLYGVDGLLDVWLTDRLATRMTVGYVDSNSEIAGSHPYIAHWSGSVVTTYQLTPRHELGVSLVYNSKRDDLNTFREDNSSEFVLANLYLSGEVSPRLSYRVGVDNVLDQRIHDTAASYSNEYNTEKARRQLWLEITWKPAF